MASRILVIEDEKDIVRLLKYNLEKESYEVLTATDGEVGLTLARKEHPNLILLDLMLPKMDGMQVCRAIRQESRVPIIMLTAKKEEIDKVIGLELGADDYVTKPFSVRELLARIKTILRRADSPHASTESAKRFGDLKFDPERFTVTLKGKAIALSTKEFAFLKILIDANGKADRVSVRFK